MNDEPKRIEPQGRVMISAEAYDNLRVARDELKKQSDERLRLWMDAKEEAAYARADESKERRRRESAEIEVRRVKRWLRLVAEQGGDLCDECLGTGKALAQIPVGEYAEPTDRLNAWERVAAMDGDIDDCLSRSCFEGWEMGVDAPEVRS